MGAVLQARIEEAVRAAGGWIPFERYMQIALHEPGLGYYAGGAQKFGAGGDFVTAPELGTLFGRTLARQLADIGGPSPENCAGAGALPAVLLPGLARPPYIVETRREPPPAQ